MKIKEFKHKIISTSYFQELKKHLAINADTFYKRRLNASVYLFKWKDGKDNYTSGSVYQHITDNLLRHIPTFKSKGVLEYGLFEIEYSIGISVSRYSSKTPAIEARLHFKVLNEYIDIDLLDTDNLSDIDKLVIGYVSQYIYLPEIAIFHGLQFIHWCSKDMAKFWHKNTSNKRNNDNYIIKWIEKHFNITGCNCIETLKRVVNRVGRQAQLTTIRRFDTSFMWSFDGDIDELENEFNEYNPIKNNILYY